MEKTLRKYDKENMKMAMLKHEETFRQQVHELHRLYRVQNLLMKDMKNMEMNNQRKSTERWNRCAFDLELPADAFIKHDEQRNSTIYNSESEADLELTLAIGSSQRKRKEETPHTSDSGASFSSSSTESGNQKINKEDWQNYQVPELSMGFRSERKSGFDQNIEQSPWLFQCLSLNMT